MSDKPIPMEGVRADQIKAGDTILGRIKLYQVDRVSEIHGTGMIDLYKGDSFSRYTTDTLVARILPEPVDAREGWWFSEVFIDYGQETQGQWHVFNTYEEAKRYAIEHNAPCDGKRIEHVRETVLSREEVNP